MPVPDDGCSDDIDDQPLTLDPEQADWGAEPLQPRVMGRTCGLSRVITDLGQYREDRKSTKGLGGLHLATRSGVARIEA
jgi:hypothetical protein